MAMLKTGVLISARRRNLWILLLGLMFLFFCQNILGASASESVPFTELGGDQCFMFSQLVHYQQAGDHYIEQPLELVIDNDMAYRKLFDPKVRRQSCDGADLSKVIINVDFSKQTVLGLWNSGSCAATGFEKKVLRDDIQKLIIYSVTVMEGNISCSGPGLMSLNLIAIPKIPAGYKVIFKRAAE